ncbi:MAG: nucleotidyl transferase AbiEii/AbiGii toxin family protein [Kiritimatiellae bacterium]|nr:nucleotidyl transferase AbiEii/AbiGii toxin family protein [Kiritimatiellia bacterium]
MNELFKAAKEVADFMTEREWRFCLIGGLAVVCWGEVRFTQDADISLLTGYGSEERFARTLLERFAGRLTNTLEFALRNRVLLLRTVSGIPIDVSFSALPFELEMLERAVTFEFEEDCALPVCTAEDLFVMKLFASRPKDVMDAESIAVRQRGKLDTGYVLRHLKELSELKEEPAMLSTAKRILEVRS